MLAYARTLAEGLGSAGGALVAQAERLIATAEHLGSYPEDVLDGYGLVRKLGVEAGATPELMERAYLESRSALSTEHAPISAPAGLSEVLEQLAPTCRVVLVTNAPMTRIPNALRALGLEGRFSAIYSSAAKPNGLRERVEAWLSEGRVLSVGDIWQNDLAPVAELGGSTALVGAPTAGARPDFSAPTLPALYDAIISWARNRPSTGFNPPQQHIDSHRKGASPS